MKQEQKHFIFRGEKVSFGLPLSSEQYLEAKHLQLELKGTLLLLKQIEVSFWWVFNRKHFKLDLTRVFEYVEFKNFKFKFTYKDKLKKLSNVSRKMLKQNPLKTKASIAKSCTAFSLSHTCKVLESTTNYLSNVGAHSCPKRIKRVSLQHKQRII